MSSWLAALERRYLADLTRAELTRALRALSSCYVERRGKLAGGAALEGAGKRAAFALFYGPVHFITLQAVLRELDAARRAPKVIHDLGCGTGVAGAAWALACEGRPTITGVDRNAWAVTEANWTYRELQLHGRATVGDALRRFPNDPAPRLADAGVVLAYAVNELTAEDRPALLQKVAHAARQGARVLVVEPIARRDRPWWPEWSAQLTAAGAREDEWRFPAALPPLLREIARGAGLDPRELTVRTLARL